MLSENRQLQNIPAVHKCIFIYKDHLSRFLHPEIEIDTIHASGGLSKYAVQLLWVHSATVAV